MTREEASFYLANMDRKYMEEGMSEALDMAIKALEQEPCDDAISRAMVEEITWDVPIYTDALNVLTEVRDKVRALPSVSPQQKKTQTIDESNFDAEQYKIDLQSAYDCGRASAQQKVGRWKFTVYDANRIGHYECSECHWNVLMNVSDYCPHCGAKMEVQE